MPYLVRHTYLRSCWQHKGQGQVWRIAGGCYGAVHDPHALHRTTLRALPPTLAHRSRAASTRVFFPDNVELAVAQSGQTEDPGAGEEEGGRVERGLL